MISLKKSESKDLFRYSLVVGLALLLSLVVNVAVVMLARAMFGFLGYSTGEFVALVYSEGFGNMFNAVCTVLTFIFPFIIITKFFRLKLSETCSFNSTYKHNTVIVVGFVLGICMIANMVSSAFSVVLKYLFNFNPIQPQIGDGSYENFSALFFALITSAVIPALIEEFAFRGIILGSLRKFGDLPAVLLSALVFAFYHGNFVQIPFAFIVGIGLGYAVILTDSIWPAIVAHCINNAFSVLANAYNNIGVLFYIFLGVGIYCFVSLSKQGEFKLLKDVPSTMGKGSRFVRLILSPSMLIFIAITIFEALQFSA